MRNLLASTVKFFYEETCGEVQIFAIKAAILTRLSPWFAVPLQFQENVLVYTFLTTNGGNKHFLHPVKKENFARKSGVRKDSCVSKINNRSKGCFTRGFLLLFCVVSAREGSEVVQNPCSCVFRSEMLSYKCIIYFLSRTQNWWRTSLIQNVYFLRVLYARVLIFILDNGISTQ